MRHWKTRIKWIRHATQIILFVLFVFVITGSICSFFVGAFSISCPTGMLQVLASSRALLPVVLIGGLVMLVISCFLGRFFCSWVCPVGTVLEGFGSITPKYGKLGWLSRRGNKYAILGGAIIGAAAAQTPVFCPICPIGSICRGALKNFEGANIGAAFASVPIVMGLELGEKRTWCRYLCPVGAVYSLVDKVSLHQVRLQTFKCVECERCEIYCPMGLDILDVTRKPYEEEVKNYAGSNGKDAEEVLLKLPEKEKLIELSKKYTTPSGECIKCYQCNYVCPLNYTAEVNEDVCNGCDLCEPECPYGAISMKEVGDRKIAEIDGDRCRGCGACIAACPVGALNQPGWSNEIFLKQMGG